MRTIKLKDNNYWDTSGIMHNRMNLKELLNAIFPIGKVEIFYDSLDHSNYFGFNWERCSLERSPIGYNPNSSDNNYKTIGNQFGEKVHTLAVNELASHTHVTDRVKNATGFGSYYGAIPMTAGGEIELKGASVEQTGNNQPHNTIHPVEVMAFWRRVS